MQCAVAFLQVASEELAKMIKKAFRAERTPSRAHTGPLTCTHKYNPVNDDMMHQDALLDVFEHFLHHQPVINVQPGPILSLKKYPILEQGRALAKLKLSRFLSNADV